MSRPRTFPSKTSRLSRRLLQGWLPAVPARVDGSMSRAELTVSPPRISTEVSSANRSKQYRTRESRTVSESVSSR